MGCWRLPIWVPLWVPLTPWRYLCFWRLRCPELSCGSGGRPWSHPFKVPVKSERWRNLVAGRRCRDFIPDFRLRMETLKLERRGAGAAGRAQLTGRARRGLPGRRLPSLLRRMCCHSSAKLPVLPQQWHRDPSQGQPQSEEQRRVWWLPRGAEDPFGFPLTLSYNQWQPRKSLWRHIAHTFCLEQPQMLTLAGFSPYQTPAQPLVSRSVWGTVKGPLRENNNRTLFFLSADEHFRFCDKPPNCPPRNQMTVTPKCHEYWPPPGEGRAPCPLSGPHAAWTRPLAPTSARSLLHTPACFKRGVGHREGGSRDI